MKIPLFKIYWDKNDIAAVGSTIRKGYGWACGSEIENFEKAISKYMGVKYCATFNSGTSALHALLLAYGIGPSDEVIVPSFTFIATANAALFVGAKPVFADIEDKTFGLDPSDVERKITERTKAIIAVHYAGCPCKIEELRKIADAHKIVLIEDAAEAMGAKVNGKMVGTIGHAAVLSFCQNKIITTGEGGAVITNDTSIYEKLHLIEKLKFIRSHGREEGEYFSSAENLDYVALGYNFRMSSITAALGVAQLKKITKVLSMRQKVAEYYKNRLSKINGLIIPEVPTNSTHAYQIFTIRIKGGRQKRDELIAYLAKNGISSKVYFEPVHLTRFYREKFGYRGGELPVTERISGEVMSLPMYPVLTKQEIDHVVGKTSEFFGRN